MPVRVMPLLLPTPFGLLPEEKGRSLPSPVGVSQTLDLAIASFVGFPAEPFVKLDSAKFFLPKADPHFISLGEHPSSQIGR